MTLYIRLTATPRTKPYSV